MHLNDLHVGSVVRLNSGSIKFTVERIQLPVGAPGQQVKAEPVVHLVGWSDRGGIHRFPIHHACLCWPKPEAERPATAAEA